MNDNDLIVRFQEKPKKEEALSNTVNTGLYIFRKQVLDRIPKNKFYDISKDLFPDLLDSGAHMYGHMANGTWIDIGKPKDLIHMNQVMSKVVYPDEDWVDHTKESEVTGESYIGKESAVLDSTIVDGIISECCEVQSSEIRNSLLMKGCRVNGSRIIDSVLGEGCVIGEGNTIKDAVLEDGTVIPPSER